MATTPEDPILKIVNSVKWVDPTYGVMPTYQNTNYARTMGEDAKTWNFDSKKMGLPEGFVAIGDKNNKDKVVLSKQIGNNQNLRIIGTKNDKGGLNFSKSEVTREKSIGESVAPILSLATIAFPGMGLALGSALGLGGTAASIVGSGLISGTLSEISGGDFLKGAAVGAIGAGVAPGASYLKEAGLSPALAKVAATTVGQAATSAVTGQEFNPMNAILSGIMPKLPTVDTGSGALNNIGNSLLRKQLMKTIT